MPFISALLLTLTTASCAPTVRPARPPTEIRALDAETLLLTGSLQPGIGAAFEAALTPTIRRVVVRSGGGSVEEGLHIAELIAGRGLEVDTLCGSSCANYIFTAGRLKTVRPGAVVGFHGEPRNSWIIALHRLTLPAAQRAALQATEARADRFYAKVGVNPRLYAHSAEFTMANMVSFWAPSPRELECVAVTNLDMWYSTDLADFKTTKDYGPRLFATSAQDVRVPKPDICAEGREGREGR